MEVVIHNDLTDENDNAVANKDVAKRRFSHAMMEEYYARPGKWPTGFFTQYKTLMQRNFISARKRMVDKLQITQVRKCPGLIF